MKFSLISGDCLNLHPPSWLHTGPPGFLFAFKCRRKCRMFPLGCLKAWDIVKRGRSVPPEPGAQFLSRPMSMTFLTFLSHFSHRLACSTPLRSCSALIWIFYYILREHWDIHGEPGWYFNLFCPGICPWDTGPGISPAMDIRIRPCL